MATKKQQEQFNKDVIAYIESVGAKKADNEVCRYELDTKAGVLFFYIPETEKCDIFSIFCRFEDHKKAFEVIGNDERLNSYTGKWNFHGGIASSVLNNLERELSPLLTKANGMTYKEILLPNKDYKMILEYAPSNQVHFRYNYNSISNGYTGLVCESHTDSIRGLLRLWPTFFDDIDDDYRKTFEKMGINRVEATEREVFLYTSIYGQKAN